MARRPLATALIGLICAVGPLLACKKHGGQGAQPSSSGSSGTASPTSFARNETLYVGGRQWGEPTSFNPLAGWQDWPVNSMNLIYETLLLYNPLDGKLMPLLAESWEVKDDSVSFKINAQAKWNDGTPVTGEDVAYTLQLG